MPPVWQKIPFTGDPYRNVAEQDLDELSAQVIDAFINEFGHTVKRPGLLQFVDLGVTNSVDGLYWSDNFQMVIAVCGGRTFKITDSAGTTTELTGATMATGTRVTFAEDGTRIIMANGGKIVYFVPTTTTLTQTGDPNAPTVVTHTDWLDQYTLALDKTNSRMYFSNIGDTTTWTALGFVAPISNPDKLTTMKVGWREVLLGGPESVEVWYNDGQTPFSILQGGIVQRGVIAPYSVQQLANNWVWIDNRRRFVALTGRTPESIGDSYDKVIQEFLAVDDCVSDVMRITGQDLYLASFPNAGRTLVYSPSRKGWHEWGNWNAGIGDYRRFKGNCYCYAKTWGKQLFGDVSNGKIYEARTDTYTDDGSTIRTLRRTGFISHGTTQRKRSTMLVLRCKRGAGNAAVSNPQVSVRWRNDGGAWSNEHWLSLGQVGEHQLELKLFGPLGMYRFRQWELVHSDASAFEVYDAEEKIEILSN